VPECDKDNPRLRQNLRHVLKEIVLAAERREIPTLEAARHWHSRITEALSVPDKRYVGAFRGEPGLERTQVRVGANYGIDSVDVSGELARFEKKLQALVAELDALLPMEHDLDADQLAAVIDLCAWVHAESVRIHSFANGNGRTARLWANSIAVRYGLPPFIRLRPRPNAGYGDAGAKSMQGDWKSTAIVFRRLLSDFLAEN
jgi:fido (protein-threonine AMPylation protein)